MESSVKSKKVHSYDWLNQNIVITLCQFLYFDYVTLCMILLGAKAHCCAQCSARPASSARSFSLAGACGVLARAQELVQFIIRRKICKKPLGLSWWMDPLGSSLEYSLNPLGFPSGFALGKSLRGPSIFSLGTPLSTLGKLPRGFIHHDILLGFSQIVPCSHSVSSPFWINRYIIIRPTSTIHHFKWLFQNQL